MRVDLSNRSGFDYHQLDLTVSLDEGTQIFEYKQLTDVPNVSFPRNPDAVVRGDLMGSFKDQNDKLITVPMTSPPGVERLRVLAETLPSHATLGLVLATMHFGSVSEWKSRKPDIRQKPKSILVEGNYEVEGNKKNVHVQAMQQK